MPRPTHFEIHASNPDRAIAFYSAVFGWNFQKWDGPMPYWMIITGPDGTPGINGGLCPRMGPEPVPGQAVNAYVCVVEVDSVDAYTAKAAAAGGSVCVPKMPIPGVGWLAYCNDTEGNIVGMMQHDPAAQ
jgi:predicted enzyme related to lactoylglutathione lyase